MPARETLQKGDVLSGKCSCSGRYVVAATLVAAACAQTAQAQDQPNAAPCALLSASLTAQPFNVRDTAASVRRVFDADPDAECLRPGADRMAAHFHDTDASFTDDALTTFGMADRDAQDTALSTLDEIAATLRPVIERLRLAALDQVITRWRSRVARGIERGRPLAPFDFRRAVIDPRTHDQPQTCVIDAVAAPRPPWSTDHPPAGRPLYVTVQCLAAGHASRVYVWVTRPEATEALDWTPQHTVLGLRIVRLGATGVPETTIDAPRTRELRRLFELARARIRARLDQANVVGPLPTSD